MTWTEIPNASLEPGAPARSADMLALRDNIAHVRDGNNKVVVFTASGTYTKPDGLKRIEVIVTGGGQAGYTVQNTIQGQAYGMPGTGGGTAIKTIEAAALGATETVTVGAGGSTSAAAGGTSSFGAHCSAEGGKGALQAAGIGGDFNVPGGIGAVANSVQSGGVSYAGKGVYYTYPTGDVAGQAAGNNSGGGGGGASRLTIGTSYGGAGGSGKVFVKEFF